MTQATVGTLLKQYLEDRRKRAPHYSQICEQAGLDRLHIKRIVENEDARPARGTLVKLADALRLDEAERTALEDASGHGERHPGFLKESRAELHVEPAISMRRAVLLLTAPEDPHKLPYTVGGSTAAIRSGVVFGPHDVVVRVTTAKNTSVLDFSQELFRRGELLRTVETIPLRDDMPMYLDKTFTNEHLAPNDYVWATIFIQALGGARDTEFPEIFYEVADERRFNFWGGIHLLTAAITVGQFDSVVEVLAANPRILQSYVRKAQQHAFDEYHREAHTITYFAHELTPRKSRATF